MLLHQGCGAEQGPPQPAAPQDGLVGIQQWGKRLIGEAANYWSVSYLSQRDPATN